MEPCAIIDKTVLHKHNCNIHFNKHLLPALHFSPPSSSSSWGNSYLNSFYFACVWINGFARLYGSGSCMIMYFVSMCCLQSASVTPHLHAIPGFTIASPVSFFISLFFLFPSPLEKKKKEKKNENNDSLGGLMKLTLVLMSFSQTDSGPQCTLIDTAPPRAQYHLPVSILRRLLSPYLPEPFVPAALSRDATAFSSSSLERPLNAFSPLIYSIIGCSPYFF